MSNGDFIGPQCICIVPELIEPVVQDLGQIQLEVVEGVASPELVAGRVGPRAARQGGGVGHGGPGAHENRASLEGHAAEGLHLPGVEYHLIKSPIKKTRVNIARRKGP